MAHIAHLATKIAAIVRAHLLAAAASLAPPAEVPAAEAHEWPAELAVDELESLAGRCDPREGEPIKWTAPQRAETFARVAFACEAVGGSRVYCAYASAVVFRESRGMASRRHTRASGEDGLGPMGLSLRWQSEKWPGEADPDFCSPEASFTVLHAIAHRAVSYWRAHDFAEVQAVFGGHWRPGTRVLLSYPMEGYLCRLMRNRGGDCYQGISAADLGDPIPRARRKAWAAEQAAAFDAQGR